MAYLCQKSFGYIPIPTEHGREPSVRKAIEAMGETLRTYGGFLLDQIGFGKRVQILVFLAHNALFRFDDDPKAALIVMPANLLK